ncbi:toxin glutamine deamidase domain-containing protein [Streptomyces botrytidirepellens]|uniref:toxin glutamine deamidase domain-containing protein n=1 Tax=Streptomyces botrytidirepellens TaxID=2486417 RepID=UPI000F4299C5|nr:toxin glutamine deamidase domain-containing protein [Streptomyces botrytidirepellens]
MDASHFAGGVIKGSAGVLNFGRSLNPTDPYNLTHPAEYRTGLNNTAAGVVRMANDPVGTVKNAWNGFKQDPAEGFGRLAPELLGTRGLGAAKSALTAGKAARAVPKPPMPKPPPPKDWSHLARATPESPEREIHAGSVQPHEAKAFIDDQYPWLKDVNNTGHPGYTNNCSHNVVAVDRRLDGHEVSAAPKQAGDHIPPHELGLHDRPKGDAALVVPKSAAEPFGLPNSSPWEWFDAWNRAEGDSEGALQPPPPPRPGPAAWLPATLRELGRPISASEHLGWDSLLTELSAMPVGARALIWVRRIDAKGRETVGLVLTALRTGSGSAIIDGSEHPVTDLNALAAWSLHLIRYR